MLSKNRMLTSSLLSLPAVGLFTASFLGAASWTPFAGIACSFVALAILFRSGAAGNRGREDARGAGDSARVKPPGS